MKTQTILIIGLGGFLVLGSITLFVMLIVGLVMIAQESVVPVPRGRSATQAKVAIAEKNWSTVNDEALVLYNQQKYHQACVVGEEAVRLAKKQLPLFHENQAVCASNLGSYYKHDQQLDKALTQFQDCLVLCEKTSGPEAVEVVEPLRDLASVYRAQGKYKEAALLIDRGLGIRDKVMASDLLAPAETPSTLDPAKLTLDRVYAKALLKDRVNAHSNDLGLLCYERQRFADAEKHFRQALAWTEKRFGKNNLQLASVVRNHAYALIGLGRNVEAEESLKRVLKLREKEIGADHFEMVSLVDELTEVYQLQGKQNDALFSIRRALAITENAKGVNSPEAIAKLRSVAYAFEAQHFLEEAEGYWLQVAERSEERFGKAHAEALSGLRSLASFYQRRDQPEKAEATYLHAIKICEEVHGPEHPQTLAARLGLAYFYREEEQFEKAEPLYQQVLALREQAFKAAPEAPEEQSVGNISQRQELLGSLHQLANFYSEQKKYALAEAMYQRILQVAESNKVADPEDSMWVYASLAELHEQQEQYALAEPLLVKAQALLEQAVAAQVARRAAPLADPAQAATEAEEELYDDDDELEPTEFTERLVTIYAKLNQPAQAEAQLAKLLVPPPEKPARGDWSEVDESFQQGQQDARLARLNKELKRYAEAETLLSQALEKMKPWVARQREKWPDIGGGQIGNLQQQLAEIYLEQGRVAEAETLLLTSIRLDEREHGSGGWLVTEGSQKLAKLYRQTDRQEQAADLEACLAANESPYWYGKKKKPKPAVTPPAASATPTESVPAPTETPAETPSATTGEATTVESDDS